MLKERGSPDPIRVQVAYQGLKPTKLPRPTAVDNPEVDIPLPFLETYGCTMISDRGKGQEYYLLIEYDDLKKRVDRVVGWVNTKYLVRNARAQEDPATRVLKKALVILPAAQLLEDVRRPKPIRSEGWARSGPGLGRPAAKFTGQADPVVEPVLHLWRGRRLCPDRSSAHVQPGPGHGEVRRAILGWVPEGRICKWLTREAIYWRPQCARRTGSCMTRPWMPRTL